MPGIFHWWYGLRKYTACRGCIPDDGSAEPAAVCAGWAHYLVSGKLWWRTDGREDPWTECNNGAKQLEPQYADAEFVPESGKSEPGSSGTKCKLESGHTVFIPWIENSDNKLYGIWKSNKYHIPLQNCQSQLENGRSSGSCVKWSEYKPPSCKNIKGWKPVLYYGSQLDERNLPERDAIRTKCVGNHRTRRWNRYRKAEIYLQVEANA